jgi:hypothetical protein
LLCVGSLPETIGCLTGLGHLHIGDNCLIGTIPSVLGTLALLTDFAFYSNKFVGTLPSTLGSLTGLTNLAMNFLNGLTGSVPFEMCKLTNLASWNFGDTDNGSGVDTGGVSCYPGCIDTDAPFTTTVNMADSLVLLSRCPTVDEIAVCAFVSDTNIASKPTYDMWSCTGSIATTDPCTTAWTGITCVDGAITELDLGGLALTGVLSSEVGLMTALKRLDLHDNDFGTGAINSYLFTLTQLTYLDLSYIFASGMLLLLLLLLLRYLYFVIFVCL